MTFDPSITRRQLLLATGAGALSLVRPSQGVARRFTSLLAPNDVVLRWNEAFLQGVRDSRLGPPMVSRALAVAHTCIYDAWAAYDRTATGTMLGGHLRRPARERSLENKATAVSYAAYRAAVDLFPWDKTSVFDPLMASLGLDAGDTSTDPAKAPGIGSLAAQAVLEFRHRDGANQLGDEHGGTPGVPYSDYTGFKPVNAPMDIRLPFDRSAVVDPNQWQPLRYVDGTGAVVTPGFVGAQWQRVVPFALESSGALRSGSGPARFGSREFVAQASDLLELSANLTDTQKAIAEYWADGPRSELPPGHWNLFAQAVARRDHHTLDQDVKLFFALTNAIFDAGICAWDNKCAFVSVRPITAIRTLFEGHRVRAWAGPGRGTQLIDGAEWFPFQPPTFPTPPFPEYASGHSTFSAAGAEILRLFTGSDRFGASVTVAAGSSKVEPGLTPAAPVRLSWRTFSDAADEAGISRRYGGIHFEQGDLDARRVGRVVARRVWSRAQAYFHGAA